ncbi:DUF7255 family protein [Mycobacterium hackensackense]|uniref:DUF7255 family protein n=1 Tax=Mycobacterium hackensackense TaxID=228909 RepID=UPI003FD88BB0
MVRTGARAEALRDLLTRAGFEPLAAGPKAPRIEDLPSRARALVQDVYSSLGGTVLKPSLQPGAWDLAFSGELVVELDEELHFNRYRAQTLEPCWAASLPWRDAYLEQAQEHEGECTTAGRWGNRWTTPSSEAMFGQPDLPGELDRGAGAPRWKQRALYDSMKDIAALHSSTTLARISVWDKIGDDRVGDMLSRGVTGHVGLLRQLIEKRTTSDQHP